MKNQLPLINLDLIGFSTSMLCAFHCAALPFLFSIAPLAGLQFLNDHRIENLIILVSFFIASFALVRGYIRQHQNSMALIIVLIGFLLISVGHLVFTDWKEILLTTCGALMVAIAHLINRKLIRQSN